MDKPKRRRGRLEKPITAFGKTMTIKEWSNEVGIKPGTIYSRIYMYHWPIEKALLRQPKGSKEKE